MVVEGLSIPTALHGDNVSRVPSKFEAPIAASLSPPAAEMSDSALLHPPGALGAVWGSARACSRRTRRGEWTRRRGARRLVTLALVAVAMPCVHALATGDFQLAYVASHSASTMSLPYRLAALWGGQSGSLLRWLFMLLVYASTAVLLAGPAHRPLMPWVSATLLGNAAFYLVLINFFSNPFTASLGRGVSDGSGLNPLLQHPVMMIHPVMLYAGLTGFAVPFSFALGALATGQLGTAWLRATRRWTLVAWTFLSVGILLGGLWAYEVLGWGGYWAWSRENDPSAWSRHAYLNSV